MPASPRLARLQILGAALLFSTGGAAVKATALSGWQVASLRSLVAAITLLVLMPGARRRWSWRAVLVGFAYGGMLTGFVLSSKLTTAANAVFLAGTAPLYVAALSPWLLGERPQRSDFVYMAVMAAGLVLCLGDSEQRFETAPDPVTGNLLAVLTGLFWALTVIGLRWLGRDEESAKHVPAAVVSGNLVAFLVCLPAALPLPALEPVDLAIVVYLGVFQIGLAYLLLTSGLGSVRALEASLLLLIEPVLNSVWSWWLHGEVPSETALAGAALILGSTLVRARWRPPPAH
jgi:drug/metabolite transporter (DMT)-like permease